MTILTIRTDKPDAELGLYDSQQQVTYEVWTAHRKLAETIHRKLQEILAAQGGDMKMIDGIVCFKGPGSFTGLRIGLSVANALSYAYKLPVIAATGEEWLKDGIERLENGEKDGRAIPEYGADVFVTAPKK